MAFFCPVPHSSPGKGSYSLIWFACLGPLPVIFEICLPAESPCSPNMCPLDNQCFSAIIMEFRNQFCSISRPCSLASALMVIKLTFYFSSDVYLSIRFEHLWRTEGFFFFFCIYLFTFLNSNSTVDSSSFWVDALYPQPLSYLLMGGELSQECSESWPSWLLGYMKPSEWQ